MSVGHLTDAAAEPWMCSICGFERPANLLAPSKTNPAVRIGPCRRCNGSSVFHPATGSDLKRSGIGRVLLSADQGTDAAWKIEARRVALELASTTGAFTINDITARVGLPMQRNLVGAFLNGLAREGRIERIGYEAGERASQHARVVAVWRGARR